MLPAVEGTLRYSDGFKEVAVTPHESAQNARGWRASKMMPGFITEILLERVDATETISWLKAAGYVSGSFHPLSGGTDWIHCLGQA